MVSYQLSEKQKRLIAWLAEDLNREAAMVSEKKRKLIDKMCEAYWAAGSPLTKWNEIGEETKRTVRWQMKCAFKTLEKETGIDHDVFKKIA